MLDPQFLRQDPKELIDWFMINRRSFPWREAASVTHQQESPLRDPYRVLVSEIMLQQTRASVVISYFLRFIKKWPTLFHLARSDEKEVVKMWEGLGYYSRARALRKAAQVLCYEYKGIFPRDLATLQKIPGIGPYTAGAVLSLAFNSRVSALDANALRVLARYFGIQESVDQAKTKKAIDAKWRVWSENVEPAKANEALIELGALVCTAGKEPSCETCPLNTHCVARQKGLTATLPIKKQRVPTETLYRPTLILKVLKQDRPHFLVRQVDGQKLMHGLYEWPFFEWDEPLEPEQAQRVIEQRLNTELSPPFTLTSVSHTFTRFKAHLYPVVHEEHEAGSILAKVRDAFSENGKSLKLLDSEQIEEIPFCSGHKTLFQKVK